MSTLNALTRWAVYQEERHLLFLHWRMDPAILRPFVPEQLHVDEFDGTAYITAIPFIMRRMHPRYVPPMPCIGSFLEVDLLTYVSVNGEPGVYFFSLHANAWLVPTLARWICHLPYVTTRCSVEREEETTTFRCGGEGADPALFDACYSPVGERFEAAPNSLDYFLMERKILYAVDARGDVYRGRESRPPRVLRTAECEIRANRLFENAHLPAPNGAPVAFYSPGGAIHTWMPRRIRYRCG